MAFKGNIETLTLKNKFYRKVLYTVSHSLQLVVMSLKPQEDIGMEKHPSTSQFIRVEKGKGIAIIKNKLYHLKNGDSIIIPPNTYHNIINTSESTDLKLYTIYSPPHHRDGVVHITKAEAAADDEHFDGQTTK